MNAHEVERVEQHPSCGVGRVVGVEELAAVLHDRTAGAAARRVGVARLARGRFAAFVYVGQEGFDGALHVIGAAELADDAGLCLRVSLLHGRAGDDLCLPAADRPLAHIAPRVVLAVFSEYLIGVEYVPVEASEHRLGVIRVRRPVHQALRLVGRRVHSLDAYLLRHLTRERAVLLGRYAAREGYDPAQSR